MPEFAERAAPATRAEPLDYVPVLIAVIVFAAMSLAAGFASDAFLEADACLHYLYARFALAEPYRFVDVWGRPVCTAVYAVPAALFGRAGTRVVSLLLAVAIAWVAARVASRQGDRLPALAVLFTLAQPLVFTHSFSELTELPFALLLGCAFLAYQSRHMWLMAGLVSLLPLSRPEGFGFLLMAFAALALHRRWRPMMLLPVGLIAWNHAGWELFGRYEAWWRWLPDHWPYAGDSAYEPGYLLHFVASLPAIVSPFAFPATLLGIGLSVRALSVARAAESPPSPSPRRGEPRVRPSPRAQATHVDGDLRPDVVADTDGPPVERQAAPANARWQEIVRSSFDRFFTDHRARCDALIAIIPLLLLASHSVLYWLGKMASNGELRYLLTVAPFWGVMSARGWAWAAGRLRVRRPYAWAAAACLAPALVNGVYRVFPLRVDDNWQAARAAADWVAADWVAAERAASTAVGGGTHPYVMASHPGIFYFLDVSPTDGTRVRDLNAATIAAPPPGTRLIWDSMYGQFNADRGRVVGDAAIKAAGWVPDPDLQAALDAASPPARKPTGFTARFATKPTRWAAYVSPLGVNAPTTRNAKR